MIDIFKLARTEWKKRAISNKGRDAQKCQIICCLVIAVTLDFILSEMGSHLKVLSRQVASFAVLLNQQLSEEYTNEAYSDAMSLPQLNTKQPASHLRMGFKSLYASKTVHHNLHSLRSTRCSDREGPRSLCHYLEAVHSGSSANRSRSHLKAAWAGGPYPQITSHHHTSPSFKFTRWSNGRGTLWSAD